MLTPSARASLEGAARQYESHLAAALPYLSGRGITEQTARQYRLGYVERPVRGDDEMVGRLAIPYLTTSGVVDIRYRSIDTNEGPKYLSRSGSKARLFSVTSLLAKAQRIFLTEGEIDCMTLNQIGLPAVGFPGANAWQSHWRLMFSDYDEVTVICDGDQAGRDFGKKLAERLDGVIVVHLPDGTDVNDLFVREGEDALRERITK